MSQQAEALHRAIARALREEIGAGQPAVGALLPAEHALVRRFGSSRHTVREALRTLAREGLIERRQGASTRVIASRPLGPYQPTMRSLDDLRQYAVETVLRLHAVWSGAISAAEAEYLGHDSGEPWLQADGVRWAGAQQICANRVFIDLRFAPMLADLKAGDALPVAINEMVSVRSGVAVAGVEQDILARAMPLAMAREMGLRAGAAALLFVRRYRDAADRIMVWSLNWHPADRFVYRMRLERGPL